MGMSAGTPCIHCTRAGCAIYDSRPEVPCRTFICGWLQPNSPLPGDMRPDQAGVIVTFATWRAWRVIRAIPTGTKVPAARLEWLKKFAHTAGLPLLVCEFLKSGDRFTGKSIEGFGPLDFIEAVKNASAED